VFDEELPGSVRCSSHLVLHAACPPLPSPPALLSALVVPIAVQRWLVLLHAVRPVLRVATHAGRAPEVQSAQAAPENHRRREVHTRGRRGCRGHGLACEVAAVWSCSCSCVCICRCGPCSHWLAIQACYLTPIHPSEVYAQAPPSLGTHPVRPSHLSPTVGQGRRQRVEHPVDRGAAVGAQPGTARVSEPPSPSGPS
jgi:hypothetical protein